MNDPSPAYPIPESLTIHPADRHELNRQLPTATVYGQPIHGNTPIIEDANVAPGTLRIRIQGQDITTTLGHGPTPRWERCDPSGMSYAQWERDQASRDGGA